MPTTKKEAPKKKLAPAAKAPKAAAAAKPMAKSNKKPEPKIKMAVVDKKGDKKSKEIEVKEILESAPQPTEEEEEELEVAAAGAAGGASQAGLAMAAASAETAAGSLKNFRHHPDIENFYRFIFENDLRYEALEIIDAMALTRANAKNVKVAKARAN